MKNFVPLILAVLLIGAGCAFQGPKEDQGQAEASVGQVPVVAVPQGFDGVLEAYDAETGIASLRIVNGGIEEIAWPADAESPAGRLGLMATAYGTRDPSTLVVAADAADIQDPEEVQQNLRVVSPTQGTATTSPLLVQGFGRVFEQTFSWRVRDAAGAVVASGTAMTDARDVGWFGPFSFEVFLPALTDTNFSLEVLDYSAKDGSEQDLVAVPLHLLSLQTTTVKAYFSNGKKGSTFDCGQVFPVERTIAQTSAVGRAAIGELLAGPTEAERAEGYLTQIPDGAALRSLVIGGRAAKADFSAALEPGGGSCRVQAIRGQIDNTLLQFDTVDDVTISVDGNAEGILQP